MSEQFESDLSQDAINQEWVKKRFVDSETPTAALMGLVKVKNAWVSRRGIEAIQAEAHKAPHTDYPDIHGVSVHYESGKRVFLDGVTLEEVEAALGIAGE